jgi:hypothetical protein
LPCLLDAEIVRGLQGAVDVSCECAAGHAGASSSARRGAGADDEIVLLQVEDGRREQAVRAGRHMFHAALDLLAGGRCEGYTGSWFSRYAVKRDQQIALPHPRSFYLD